MRDATNIYDIKAEQSLRNADPEKLPPGLRKVKEALDRAQSNFDQGIEAHLDQSGELKAIAAKIEHVKHVIGNGQAFRAHLQEHLEGYTTGFDEWPHAAENAVNGFDSILQGEIKCMAAERLVKRFTDSLDRYQQRLHDLQAEYAAKKAALGK